MVIVSVAASFMKNMTDDDDYKEMNVYQQLGTDLTFTVHEMKLNRALRWTGRHVAREKFNGTIGRYMYQTWTTTSDLRRITARSDSGLVGGLTRGNDRSAEEVLCVQSTGSVYTCSYRTELCEIL